MRLPTRRPSSRRIIAARAETTPWDAWAAARTRLADGVVRGQAFPPLPRGAVLASRGPRGTLGRDPVLLSPSHRRHAAPPGSVALRGTRAGEPARAGLSAAVRRRPHAALRIRPARWRGSGLPVRERDRRREGGSLQLPRGRPVPAARSPRPRRDGDRARRHRDPRLPRSARRTRTPHGRLPAGPPARAAAVHERRRRLRCLRLGPLRRAAARRAPRRPRPARPVVRLLRPYGGVRQRHQGDRRGGARPDRRRVAGGHRAGPGRGLSPHRRHDRPPLRRERLAAAGRYRSPARAAVPRRRRRPVGVQPRGVPGRGRAGEGIRPGRRRLSGGAEPPARGALRHAGARDLPHAPRGEPEPVHVLPADARGSRSWGARPRSWSA